MLNSPSYIQLTMTTATTTTTTALDFVYSFSHSQFVAVLRAVSRPMLLMLHRFHGNNREIFMEINWNVCFKLKSNGMRNECEWHIARPNFKRSISNGKETMSKWQYYKLPISHSVSQWVSWILAFSFSSFNVFCVNSFSGRRSQLPLLFIIVKKIES